jgi:PAS domain S-box-containing protein
MNLFSLAAFTSFLVSVTVAVDGLKRDHRTLKGYLFFSLAICVALWAFAYTFFYSAETNSEAWLWYRLSGPGWSFLPAVSLHFILVLSGVTRFSRFRLLFIYFPAVLLTWRSLTGIVLAERFIVGLSPATLEIHATSSPWYIAYVLYQVSFLLVGAAVLLHWRRSTTILRYRKQADTVLFCLATALVLMNSMNFLPSLLGYQMPASAATILVVVVLGAWYATTRYRMLELTPELAAGYIMSKMLDGVMLVDLAGKVRVVNDQVTKILGVRRRELLGKDFNDFLVQATLPDNSGFFPAHTFSGSGQLEVEVSFGLQERGKVPCFVALSSLLDSAGESAGTVAVIHDMRMEKELKEAKGEAENANRAKSLFLAHMGHDIKTPLNNIIGFAQILVSETDGRSRINRLASSIMENGGYLLDLLNDILDITQMEAGQMKIEKAEFSLPNLLKEVAVGSRLAARQNGLDFFVKIQPAIPRFPVGDKK